MKTFKITILFFIFSSSYGQSNLTSIKNWKNYAIPQNEDTLHKYNSDPNDWIVSFDKNEVYVVSKRKHSAKSNLPFEIKPSKDEERIFRGKRSVLEVNDGFLIGFYRGEWGGNFYWFSKDGTNKYKISNHEIVQFKVRDNKIYAIEGLGHLSYSEGSIIEIKNESGKWKTIKYLNLTTAPYAFELDSKNNFIIVNSSSILSVDATKNIDTLLTTEMWQYLFPTSLVIQDNTLFIGMRKGVFKFDLLTKKEEWLLPD